MKKKKVAVLGASGMLGYTLFTELSLSEDLTVFGTLRSIKHMKTLLPYPENILDNVVGENFKTVEYALKKIQPDIVINCIGIVKQSSHAINTQMQIYINALLPYLLANLCKKLESKLIQFSTDCVFSGEKGMYTEKDISDAKDIYGKTKFLGEVTGQNCLTIRTSIIGHGLNSHYSLIDWFLQQKGFVNGYANVLYSGLPTTEIARIIKEVILPNETIQGLYHISSEPISKYNLLKLVAKRYDKKINITQTETPISDRSLNSILFRKTYKYTPPAWPELITQLYNYYKSDTHFISYEK